jgi:hypothetical protein
MALVLDGNGTMTVGNGDITGLATGALPSTVIGAGAVLQVVNGSTTTQVEGSFSTATNLGLSASITPSSASSKILVLVSANGLGSRGSSTYWDGYLVRGSTNIGAFVNYCASALVGGWWGASLSVLDSPATTSSTTYKLQGIRQGGSDNCVFNISSGGGGTGNISTITLMEIAV